MRVEIEIGTGWNWSHDGGVVSRHRTELKSRSEQDGIGAGSSEPVRIKIYIVEIEIGTGWNWSHTNRQRALQGVRVEIEIGTGWNWSQQLDYRVIDRVDVEIEIGTGWNWSSFRLSGVVIVEQC